MNNNKPYRFTAEHTQAIIDNYIKPSHKDIKYVVRESNTSSSIYVQLFKNNIRKTVRFADHPGKTLKYNYISKRTKVKKVVAVIEHAIKRLNEMSIDSKLEAIHERY